jgi:hypothetical protein
MILVRIYLALFLWGVTVSAQPGCRVNAANPGHFELFTYATAANACTIDNLPLSTLVALLLRSINEI